MGCTTSMVGPYPHKRPLVNTTVFLENTNNLNDIQITTFSDENQNHSVIDKTGSSQPNGIIGSSQPNGIIGHNQPNGTKGSSLPNGVLANGTAVSENQSSNTLLIADAVDSSTVVPYIEQDQNNDSSERNSTPPSRLSSERLSRRSQSLPVDMKTGIKSVLKTGGARDHILTDRPIKTVTFVESVTVVTVM